MTKNIPTVVNKVNIKGQRQKVQNQQNLWKKTNRVNDYFQVKSPSTGLSTILVSSEKKEHYYPKRINQVSPVYCENDMAYEIGNDCIVFIKIGKHSKLLLLLNRTEHKLYCLKYIQLNSIKYI